MFTENFKNIIDVIFKNSIDFMGLILTVTAVGYTIMSFPISSLVIIAVLLILFFYTKRINKNNAQVKE